MSGGFLHHALGVSASKSLAARGGLARTFGGIVSFLVVLFLSWGIYLIHDAFAHPITAEAVALLAAAFVLALAAILLFFLIGPRRRVRAIIARHATNNPRLFRKTVPPVLADDFRKDLAYQRTYIDHSRIRP